MSKDIAGTNMERGKPKSEVSSTGLLSDAEIDAEINRFASGLRDGSIGHGVDFLSWMTVYRNFEKVSNFPMSFKSGYRKQSDNANQS